MTNTNIFHPDSVLSSGSHQPAPCILLYNFASDQRTRLILQYLQRENITARMVQTAEFLHPLGYLFEIPGFAPFPQFNLSGNFQDEMMVMKDLSREKLQAFLQFFRDNALPPVALKAVLTPVTVHWNSLELHKELSEEHKALQ